MKWNSCFTEFWGLIYGLQRLAVVFLPPLKCSRNSGKTHSFLFLRLILTGNFNSNLIPSTKKIFFPFPSWILIFSLLFLRTAGICCWINFNFAFFLWPEFSTTWMSWCPPTAWRSTRPAPGSTRDWRTSSGSSTWIYRVGNAPRERPGPRKRADSRASCLASR